MSFREETVQPGIIKPAETPSGLSRRAKLWLVALVVIAVTVFGGLPFILLTLPDPQPVLVSGLGQEVSGTFVESRDGMYKLYPYSAPLFEFPEQALGIKDSSPRVAIKYRQLDSLARYEVQSYASGAVIGADKVVDQASKTLRLAPKTPLAPGDYVIVTAKDGADAGSDYFYFRILPE